MGKDKIKYLYILEEFSLIKKEKQKYYYTSSAEYFHEEQIYSSECDGPLISVIWFDIARIPRASIYRIQGQSPGYFSKKFIAIKSVTFWSCAPLKVVGVNCLARKAVY